MKNVNTRFREVYLLVNSVSLYTRLCQLTLVDTAIVIGDDPPRRHITRHHQKLRTTSVKNYGTSENLWMGNTLQSIKTVMHNNEKALAVLLNEQRDDFDADGHDKLLLSKKHIVESLEELASLEAYIISCGAKEKVYTGKWENIAEKWR